MTLSKCRIVVTFLLFLLIRLTSRESELNEKVRIYKTFMKSISNIFIFSSIDTYLDLQRIYNIINNLGVLAGERSDLLIESFAIFRADTPCRTGE